MSCTGTPSGRQADHSRRRRHHDRIRFVAASLTVVFDLPLSDVTVVDGERAVLECPVAVTPAAEVTWYVENVSDPAGATREQFDDMMPSTSQQRQAERDIVVLRREGVLWAATTAKPSAFYATQIDADVDASPVHRLVYVGDVIARHVTNQSVGDRIAPAAIELCGQLERVAMTSRNAVSGDRRLAEKKTANTWIGADAGGGDYGGLSR